MKSFVSKIVWYIGLGLMNAILFVKMLTDAIVIEPSTSRIVFAGLDLYFTIAFALMVVADITIFSMRGSEKK